MNPNTELNPVSRSDRIDFLDALRGFAVLGIFIANLPYFAGTAFLGEEELASMQSATWDAGVMAFQHIFVEAKFYSLFSLLFGVGFGLQQRRAMAKDQDFYSFFARRMWFLLLMGFIHLIVWIGDILVLYALLGFLLLLFREMPPRKLLIWAGVFLAAPVLLDAVRYSAGGNDVLATPFFAIGSRLNEAFKNPDDLITQMKQPGLVDFFQCNIAGMFFRFGDFIYTNRPFKVLGMFLVGLWIVKSGLIDEWQHRQPVLKRVLLLGLLIGVPANIGVFAISEHIDGYSLHLLNLVKSLLQSLGVVTLCLAYVAWMGLIWISSSTGGLLRNVVPVGRMSLSNYFLQTLIGICVFHGVGCGFVGSVGDIYLLFFGMGFFVLQSFLSAWWLKRFRFGPAEWLWRSLSYGKRQALS